MQVEQWVFPGDAQRPGAGRFDSCAIGGSADRIQLPAQPRDAPAAQAAVIDANNQSRFTGESDRCVVKPKADHEVQLLGTLAARYFAVIPPKYRTYCSLTAEVSRRVLKHFGVGASLLPCQVWCSSPNGEQHVVGFVGRGSTDTKWDGHVVCITNGYILDAALHHLEREFSVPVPAVLVVQRNRLTSQSIAVATLAGGQTLLWLQPPRSAPLTIPVSPTEMVNELAQKLIVDLQNH